MLLDDELKGILAQVKTIAVIGASDRPGRPVDMVGRYLIQAGYTVIPVHPKRKTVWGAQAFASVLDVPVT
ncbi:MAG: CoA-binding protein, partial [Thermodesulfobacteriota bacterium]|nr:CoA-binding protein [Thermodesulfobacteriota bacterium]